MPKTVEDWKEIENLFLQRWNFPRCCGAIDKHVVIKRPPCSGSLYCNYKKTYSIILFAMVDADYCFTHIDVGGNGRASDSAVFRDSTLNIAMENEEKIFNYRLSRARRVSENAFGILTWRFRVFSRPIELKPDTIDRVVWAACSLHNWLRKTAPSHYMSQQSVDREDFNTGEVIPGEWRQNINILHPVTRLGNNNGSQIAKRIRQEYMTYFTKENTLPWQWEKLGLEKA
nr:unnamed protein product [Callosobruchus chinensis]